MVRFGWVALILAGALWACSGSGSSGSSGSTSAGSTGTTTGSTTGSGTTSSGGTTSSSTTGSAPAGAAVTYGGGTAVYDEHASCSFSEDFNNGTQYVNADAYLGYGTTAQRHFSLYAVLPSNGTQQNSWQVSYSDPSTAGSFVSFDVDAGATTYASSYTFNLNSASLANGVSHVSGSFSGTADDGGTFSGTINF